MPHPFTEIYLWLDWLHSYFPEKNGQLFITIAGSLIGTFGGAYGAHKLALWDRKRDEAFEKIRAYNSAIMIAFDIGNAYLNFKEQQVWNLWKDYRTSKEVFLGPRAKPTIPRTVEFLLDSMTPFNSPFEKLEELAYSKIGLNGRPLHLVSNIIRTADALSNVMSTRNRLMQEFHDGLSNNSTNDNIMHYFGLPDTAGISNTRISDNIDALYGLTEDIIEFSRRLCKDLERQARLSKKTMKLKAPDVNETDFTIAEEKGMMPNPLNYRSWDDDNYNRKKLTKSQKIKAYLNRLLRRT